MSPNAFRNTADIMAFFEEEIGVAFPWEKYDQSTITDFNWGGMENTTLTTLSQRTLHGDEVENLQERGTRSLDAHEMAHQWFGDYVTCKDWSHVWLNEGFATYYTELYEGHKCGHDAMLYRLYQSAQKSILKETLTSGQSFFGVIVLHKSSLTIEITRKRLGCCICCAAK